VRRVVGSSADLKFSVTKRYVKIIFNSPIQLADVAYVPRVLQRFAPVQPAPGPDSG